MLKLTEKADLAVLYEADVARYRAASEDRFTRAVTKDVFTSFYATCPSIGFEQDGQPIGGIIFDGEEAHIAVLPSHHGRWALLLKPALQWLFSLKDEILVEVERDNDRALAFMDRHGWERVQELPDDIVYRLVPQGGTRKTAYQAALPRRPRPISMEVSSCLQTH